MTFSSLMTALSERLFHLGFRVLTPSPTPFGITEDVTVLGSSSVDFTWLFLKMVFAMIVVIALAIVVIRYLIPKLHMQRGMSRRTDIKILDRIPLDSRKMLFVLEIEGKRLLLGASENHVGLVADLGAASAMDDDEKA